MSINARRSLGKDDWVFSSTWSVPVTSYSTEVPRAWAIFTAASAFGMELCVFR